MNDQEIREAGDADCIRSDINVLEIMVSQYNERGGGHSQKEALNTAIKYLKHLVAIKASGVLPEKVKPFPLCETCITVKHQAEDCAVVDCAHYPEHERRYMKNKAIDETAVKLVKFLSGLEREIQEIVQENHSHTETIDNVRDIVKAITDHIKSKMGVSDVNS